MSWYHIRAYEPDDAAFIFSAWCHQIRSREPFRWLDDEAFRAYKREALEPLVSARTAVVACNRECRDQRYGFAVADPDAGYPVLHFVYVRGAPAVLVEGKMRSIYRRRGVATAMLSMLLPSFGSEPIYYTHPTRETPRLERAWRLRYFPLAVAWRPHAEGSVASHAPGLRAV